MKTISIGIACLILLAGCSTAEERTLEDAQALCAKQGGLLTVIYTQDVTMAGIGKRVGHAGACVPLSKFGAGFPAPGAAAAPPRNP